MNWDAEVVTPGMSRALLKPYLSAVAPIVGPPRRRPMFANGVLQDSANAWLTGVWPDPLPQGSSLSSLSRFPFGSFSGCGEKTAVFGFRAALPVYQEELVTILNVEPGGRVVWAALLISGLGVSLVSCPTTLPAFCVLRTLS